MTPKVNVTVTERGGRRYASTGSAWEPKIGYSRAVRAGDVIAVTGTVGVEADGTFAPGVAAQARRALEIILAAVEALGGKASDVIRTRMYMTDIAQVAGGRRGPRRGLRPDPPGDDPGRGRPPDRRRRPDRDRGRRRRPARG